MALFERSINEDNLVSYMYVSNEAKPAAEIPDFTAFLCLLHISSRFKKLNLSTPKSSNFPQSAVSFSCPAVKTMKLRVIRPSSSLFVVVATLAGSLSLFSHRIEQPSPYAPHTLPQQDLWIADSLSSSPGLLPPPGPPSIRPTTNTVVIVANTNADATAAAADLKDDPNAFCANTERSGSKNRKNLRIRNNEEACAPPNGGVGILDNKLNINLPDWATPWKPKKNAGAELAVEQNDYDSCLGVSTPAGMALPYHLCCLGIVHAYVNGLADRISNCVFDFTRCESYTWNTADMCCQTFSIELGSEYATGINCLPRI